MSKITPKFFIRSTPVDVFATLHFLGYFQIGPVSKGVFYYDGTV